MKRKINPPTSHFFPIKMITVLVIIISGIAMMSFGTKNSRNHAGAASFTEFVKDSVKSVKAFRDVYKVLMSPRCMNCHPAGDIPLQGDDSHLHTMSPVRGKDGKGVYAMKCANCHQPENTPGLNTPPGNPNWHLPPGDMKMVFQGRTAPQLAKQLVNPRLNGHKTLTQLLAHADDTLVKSSWNPGEGRTLPPLSYEDFKKAWTSWIVNGAYATRN
jgi:hypothetical protein